MMSLFSVMQVQIGSLSEVIGALAALAGTALSVVALITARRANESAADVRRREADRDRREVERDRRNLAGSLQAWWAGRDAGANRSEWGVVISNEGGQSSVFHDVTIDVSGNARSNRITMRITPPGRYIVKSQALAPNNQPPWDLPRPIPAGHQFDPLTKSDRMTVDRIRFTDQLGDRWQWSPRHGVQRGSDGSPDPPS